MDAVTYPSEAVFEFLRSNLIPLRVPSNAQPYATDFNIKRTPALITLGPDAREHHRSIGFLEPDAFIAVMLLGIGKFHFDNDRFSEALAVFTRIVNEYKSSDAVPEAIFLSGVSNFKSSHDPKLLKDAYERLQHDFPGNEWTKRAYPYRLL